MDHRFLFKARKNWCVRLRRFRRRRTRLASSYAAFISYKHIESGTFARNLERALKAYARPFWKRPPRIFRDEAFLVPGTPPGPVIRAALQRSDVLIYLASPQAASSVWVIDELTDWCSEANRVPCLVIVLTDGEIGYNSVSKVIDWARTDALPHALSEALTLLPLFVDARSLNEPSSQTLTNSEFRRAVNQIAARIRGIDPYRMADVEEITYRRNRVAIGVTAVALLFLTAGLFYVDAGRRAQQTVAFANRATAEVLASLEMGGRLDEAAQSAKEALVLASGPLTRQTANAVLRMLPKRLWRREFNAASNGDSEVFQRMAVLDNKIVLRHADREGTVIDARSGDALGSVTYPSLGRTDLLASARGMPSALDAGASVIAGPLESKVALVSLADGRIIDKADLPVTSEGPWDVSAAHKLGAQVRRDGYLHTFGWSEDGTILRGRGPCACSIAFSANGALLARSLGSRGGFDQVVIYASQDMSEAVTLPRVSGSISSLAWGSGDADRMLAVLVGDAFAEHWQIYDTATQVRVNERPLPGSDLIAISSDGTLVATAQSSYGDPVGNTLSVFDRATGRLVARAPVRNYTIDTLAFGPGSRFLFVAGVAEAEDSVRPFAEAWDVSAAGSIFDVRVDRHRNAPALAFDASNASIAIASSGAAGEWAAIDVVSVAGGHLLTRIDLGNEAENFAGARQLAFNGDGSLLAMVEFGNRTTIYRTDTGQSIPRAAWDGEDGTAALAAKILKLSQRIDSDRAVTSGTGSLRVFVRDQGRRAGADCTIEVNAERPRTKFLSVMPQYGARCDQVDDVAIRGDDTAVAVAIVTSGGQASGEVQLFERLPAWFRPFAWLSRGTDWRRVASYPLRGQASTVAFSPDGKRIAVRDGSGTVHVLDRDANLLALFVGRNGSTSPSAPDIAFSPDGAWLATTQGPNGGPTRWRVDDAALLAALDAR